MSEEFYADGRLYDALFPVGASAVAFYRAEVGRDRATVLELGCGTGRKLVPLAVDGHRCTGLDSSAAMLDRARLLAAEHDVEVEWVRGDMRSFDLGRAFDAVLIPGNSLLHLHEHTDLVSCLRAVRRHLAPGGRLVLDVFNPSIALLARADGTRRDREDLTSTGPDRGTVRVEVEEAYDAAAQVTRGRWTLSWGSPPASSVLPLEIRSVFPQELLLLLEAAGLRLVDRFGDWSRTSFTSGSPLQIVVAEAD